MSTISVELFETVLDDLLVEVCYVFVMGTKRMIVTEKFFLKIVDPMLIITSRDFGCSTQDLIDALLMRQKGKQ